MKDYLEKARGNCTFSTNVLSLSGISRGMVVLTSTIADRGMLTLGLDDYKHKSHAIQIHTLYRMTFSDIDIQWRPKLVVVFSS